ncbi:heparan-alpha-glucosaminide N-acetyltransferase domain-containing protein [Microbacterium sp. RURRCA19A]|uniref:heparan-alpha-glucosaminide N-acetyltransferase domain-containing protein n=1 Tax=Microbacterium sp. RURRCA19A TaxID=1907391 RepID=UPI00095586E9|nr:heparan-alpha-glucosaminide N-acetyltransferase domain-containing protein [Microbacterium sp. RURRCA19A]SIR57176.1 Protein of unknown function [Microbacterium sp. RURRCA19A]
MDIRTALAPPARRVGSPRVWGIDIARFLALAGMMMAHVWQMNTDGSASVLYPFVSGRAAALFAVLAGVGISLTTHTDLAAGRFGAARAAVFGRGMALIVLGLTLGLMPSGPFIILAYYGVLFWVLVPLLRVPSPILLTLAGVLALAWPPVSMMVRTGLPPFELGSPSWLSLADPAMLFRGLFLTGIYPVPTWIVYALVGLVVGRAVRAATDTGAVQRLAWRMTAIGAASTLVAWGVVRAIAEPTIAGIAERLHADPATVTSLYFGDSYGTVFAGDSAMLLSPSAHSGTTLDLALTVGIALAVLGLCLLLGTVLSARVRRVFEPLRRAGAAPLTIYALHGTAVGIAMLIAQGNGNGPLQWYTEGAGIWALNVAGALLIGTILMITDRRGPLEAAVTWTGRQVSRPWRRAAVPA